MDTIEKRINDEYEEALRKLQERWEVSDEEYENIRSTWIMKLVEHKLISLL